MLNGKDGGAGNKNIITDDTQNDPDADESQCYVDKIFSFIKYLEWFFTFVLCHEVKCN